MSPLLRNIVLSLLTLAHIYVLIHLWPNSISRGLAEWPIGNSQLYTDISFGLAVAVGLVVLARAFRRGRYAAMLVLLIITVIATFVYGKLPIAASYAPSALFVGLGVVLGVLPSGTSLWMRRPPSEETISRTGGGRIPLYTLFVLALNFLIAVAPWSQLVPSGFRATEDWSWNSWVLRHSDTVAIQDNIIFVSVRNILNVIFGASLFSSNITSMVLCAIGVAFLALSVQLLFGRVAGLLALAFMITDRWVMATAFSGNLSSSPLPSCGVLLFTILWLLTRHRVGSPYFVPRVFITVAVTCVLAMYSYAAVRIPWILSAAVLSVVFLLIIDGSLPRRLLALCTSIATPIGLSGLLVATIVYGGDVTSFKRDLLAEWPAESIRSHPGPDGMQGFTRIPSSDTPIWTEVARPTDGRDFSVIWTRTPRESLAALLGHVGHILAGHGETFFLQPGLFFLLTAMAFRLCLSSPADLRPAVVFIAWGAIWISPFLLVPDAAAYRRGVSFSAVASSLAVVAFVSNTRLNRPHVLTFILALALCAMRFPGELAFSNTPGARGQMYVVCPNAFALRQLLVDVHVQRFARSPLYLVRSRFEGPINDSCRSFALGSQEWRRIVRQSRTMEPASGQLVAELGRLPPGAAALIYCSLETMRDQETMSLCTGATVVASVVASIPIDEAGTLTKWMVLSPSALAPSTGETRLSVDVQTSSASAAVVGVL